MGRWEPNARGRLAQAAMELFGEQGLEQTTVAQIAGRAGLTERTFFRHFADKREVLFYGSETAQERLAAAIAAAPAGATPIEAVSAALEALAGMFEENPERVRARDAVIAAHPELRERELIKLAGMAATMAAALGERGVGEPVASLTAETGIAVLKVAFTRWVGDPGRADLPVLIRESLAELRKELA
jgi:AcrR family transcriptional regulator